jgi:Pvc16 N-terminal domain
MANVFAVHSVGSSIVTFLRNAYPTELASRAMPACGFELTSSGQLAGEIDETTRITLYLYRITVNEHSRQARPARAVADTFVPLGLDLHYLLTAWAANPLDEQVTLAWAVRQLHQFPILDASSLSPEAGWGRDEVIQIVPAELTTEDVMRIWDALDPAYRLSMSYVARLVRLDPDQDTETFRPVVAGRFAYGTEARG